jgi:hypothetical protein
MNQAEIHFNQELQDDILGDGVLSTFCVLAAAILCIPFFGFLPLLAACLGLVSMVATTRLLETLES